MEKKWMKKICPAILAGALAVLPAACASVQKAETDSRIESAAKNSYVFKTYLQNDNVTVSAENGKVTLTGSVSDESERILAQDTVQNLPGVRTVDNRLEVKGGAVPDTSDEALASRVKATILTHRGLSAEGTDVSVRNGVVTLRGEADNEAQRELTAEYIKDLNGVKGVVNEMTVKGVPGGSPQTLGQKIDDASITAQVTLALMSRSTTRAIDAQVDTNNGIVTVRGSARNPAEKELISKVISDVQGVRGVDNKMSVSGS